MSIMFTQFLRPNGRPIVNTIDASPELETLAHNLIENGARFEIEVLTTGEIFMECRKGEDILSNQLCKNGPEVLVALENLIHAADEKLT